MGGADHAIYHIVEFEVTWPIVFNQSWSEEQRRQKFKVDLIGSKVLISKERQVMKYFYPNVDKDTFDIDGSKIGINGLLVMQNSTQFKFRNEVGFSNVYEYFSDKEFKTQKALVVETILTTNIQKQLTFNKKY